MILCDKKTIQSTSLVYNKLINWCIKSLADLNTTRFHKT